MTAVGGSIQELNIDGRIFAVAADAEAQRQLGGWENEVQANGNSTARLIKTRVPLMIEGVAVEINDTRGDHEYLQEKANLTDFFTLGITYASGLTYQGRAQITSELKASSQAATAPLTLSGPGILTKQT